jgi:hypothetical protein
MPGERISKPSIAAKIVLSQSGAGSTLIRVGVFGRTEVIAARYITFASFFLSLLKASRF